MVDATCARESSDSPLSGPLLTAPFDIYSRHVLQSVLHCSASVSFEFFGSLLVRVLEVCGPPAGRVAKL